jgi:hypothetical protein
MEVVSTSETSENFYQTRWHNNPEDSQLQILRITRLLWNLKILLPYSQDPATEPILNQLNSVCSFITCFFHKQHSQITELLIVSEVTAYSH